MTPPTVRVNTFVQTVTPYLYTDFISKVYVALQTIAGSQRLNTLCNLNISFRLVLFAYSMTVHCVLLFCVVGKHFWFSTVGLIQLFVYTLLSYILGNRLTSFYNELNIFDKNVGCTPKVTWKSIQNMIQMFIISFVHILLMWPMSFFFSDTKKSLYVVFISLSYTFEVYYYGHLLSLLIPRLKLINHCMETSLSDGKPGSVLKEYVHVKGNRRCGDTPTDMRKITDLYMTMVNAFNYLIDSIKWQLLVSIILMFCTLLFYCYVFSLVIISGSGEMTSPAAASFGWTINLMIPLFSPCIFADSVHRQVKKLRELLASRLYENKLDKTSRSITRALLAFTEMRNLSFRLLRILDIDISLPFKFVGLLITYLIIILQFEKVINSQGQ